jgi:hypothetical protein
MYGCAPSVKVPCGTRRREGDKYGRNEERGMKADKDISIIPNGPYCYGVSRKDTCPYWSIKDDLPHQYNGYCSYLEQSDVDITLSMKPLTNLCNGEKVKAVDLPFPVSLLWDQCKECGINDEDEDDISADLRRVPTNGGQTR